jgi:hypothetical protein
MAVQLQTADRARGDGTKAARATTVSSDARRPVSGIAPDSVRLTGSPSPSEAHASPLPHRPTDSAAGEPSNDERNAQKKDDGSLKQEAAASNRGRNSVSGNDPLTAEWKSTADEQEEEEEEGGDDGPTTDSVMLTAEEWTMMQQLHNEHAQRAALVEQLQSEAEERRMQMEKMKQKLDALEQQRIDEEARSVKHSCRPAVARSASSLATRLPLTTALPFCSSVAFRRTNNLEAHSH